MNNFVFLCDLKVYCILKKDNLEKGMKSCRNTYKSRKLGYDYECSKEQIKNCNEMIEKTLNQYTYLCTQYFTLVDHLEFIDNKMKEIFNPDEFIQEFIKCKNDGYSFLSIYDYCEGWIIIQYQDYIFDKLEQLKQTDLSLLWKDYWQKNNRIKLKNGFHISL